MKVLLVNGARSVQQIMAARLVSDGHDVVPAANGQVAVEKFAQTASDLVLMDVKMPFMNGFEAGNRHRVVSG